jgi:hypothetical protein
MENQEQQSCSLEKNQTSDAFLEMVMNDKSIKGVGLIVNKHDDGVIKKDVVPDVTYEEVERLSENSLGFKFIPYGVNITIHGEEIFFESFDSVPKDNWY